jgi:hypothetical protein
MPRGRLIFPFLVDIARLDTAATAEDPDDTGPLVSGYDDEFREPVMIAPEDSSDDAELRRVEVMTTLQAQIGEDQNEAVQMMVTGPSPSSRMTLVFHYRDLERAGMVSTETGRPVLRAPGDRLHAIRNIRTGAMVELIPARPGLYATEVKSSGFGLGPNRNLCIVTFEERATSTARTG